MKYKKIIPLGYQVLVKQDPEEDKVSDTGVVRPDSVESEQKSFGEVLEVGENVTKVKVGDHIVYGTWSGDDVELNKEDYKVVHEKFILAKLK